MATVSALPMVNQSRVIAADLATATRGVVLAEWRQGEYVTWRVDRLPSATAWHAFHGHYFTDYTDALVDYDKRRAGIL